MRRACSPTSAPRSSRSNRPGAIPTVLSAADRRRQRLVRLSQLRQEERHVGQGRSRRAVARRRRADRFGRHRPRRLSASRRRRSLLVRQVRPLPRLQDQRRRLPRAGGLRAAHRPARRPAAHPARLPVGDHGRAGRLHPGDGRAARPAEPPLRGERARGHHRARRVPGHRGLDDRHAAEALGFQPLHADLSDGRLSLQARLDRHHHRDPGAVEIVLRPFGHARSRPPSAARHGPGAAGPRRRTGGALRAALPRPHGRGMVCRRTRAAPALRHRARHEAGAGLAGVPRAQGHRADQDGRQDGRSAGLAVSSDAHAGQFRRHGAEAGRARRHHRAAPDHGQRGDEGAAARRPAHHRPVDGLGRPDLHAQPGRPRRRRDQDRGLRLSRLVARRRQPPRDGDATALREVVALQHHEPRQARHHARPHGARRRGARQGAGEGRRRGDRELFRPRCCASSASTMPSSPR